MVTKIIAGIVLILTLAAAGTVGVAYYNDPTLFDSNECSGGCPLQKMTESLSQPSSDATPSCCESGNQAAEKSCCESKP